MSTPRWLKYTVWLVLGLVVFGASLGAGHWVATRAGRNEQVDESEVGKAKINDPVDVVVGEDEISVDEKIGVCDFWSDERQEWTVVGDVQTVASEGDWYLVSLKGCDVTREMVVRIPMQTPSVQWGYTTEDGLRWEILTAEEMMGKLTVGTLVAVVVPVVTEVNTWVDTNFESEAATRTDCEESPICAPYLEFLEAYGEDVEFLARSVEQGKMGTFGENMHLYSTKLFGLENLVVLEQLKTQGTL